MKKFAVVALLLASFGTTARAQRNVSQLLFQVTRCLAAKHFLPQSSTWRLTLGYKLDGKSYPGEKIIYVVTFRSSTESSGTVFAVFSLIKDGHESFNIQNNAGFVLTKQEPIGVSFTTPPLGGNWTQRRLASAIREIEKRRRFMISSKDLSARSPCNCESYTDRHPDG